MALVSTLNYGLSAQSFKGGSSAGAGRGDTWKVAITGQGDVADQLQLDLLTSQSYTLAAGDSIGTSPIFAMTLANRIYYLSGNTLYFGSLASGVQFESPGAGAGFIEMSNQFAAGEALTGLAPYQGKLAVISRSCTQIWVIDPDPANFAQSQVLPNIGTPAPLSVQAVGDMDVYMLADNGVRSLRVRDASNNAIIADVGTPIDALLQSVLTTLTDGQKAKACSVVEPSSNRYWLYLPDFADADNGVGKIYVFSYFPSGQIAAWSTYSPTYQGDAVAASDTTYPVSKQITYAVTVGQRYAWTPGASEVRLVCGSSALTGVGAFVATSSTVTVTGTAEGASFTGTLTPTTAFVPEKFVVHNGQVYTRDGVAVYQHGGADNNSFENCGVTARTPYIDSGSPATRKKFTGIDAGFSGTWQIGVSADYITQSFRSVYNNTASSYRLGRIGYAAVGTHYALELTESGNGAALFSSAIMHIAGAGAEK